VDYKGFIMENNPLCINSGGGVRGQPNTVTVWTTVTRTDYVDSKDKYATVGWSADLQKLFVRLNGDKGTWKVPQALELFEVEDLRTMAKPGRRLIHRIGDSVWHAQAEFVVGQDGIATAIELSVKSKSDDQAEIVTVPIGYDLDAEVPVTGGEKKTVQVAEAPVTEVKYPAPGPATITGPKLPEEEVKGDAKAKAPAKVVVPTNVSTGSLAVTLTQKSLVEVETDWAKDKEVTTRAYCDFELLNKGAAGTVVITKRTLEYKKGEDWVEIPHLIGNKVGNWNWNMRDDKESMSLGAKGHMTMSFCAVLTSPCTVQKDRQRRLGKNLPNPLTLRLTLSDMNGASSNIVYSYSNAPLELKSLEKSKANADKKARCFGWLGCDDIELDDRAVVEAFVTEEHKKETWTIKPSFGNTYWTMQDTNWKKVAFEAAKADQAEYPLANMQLNEQYGWKFSATALVDIKNRRTYGVRFNLKTNSGTAEQSFLLAPEKYL